MTRLSNEQLRVTKRRDCYRHDIKTVTDQLQDTADFRQGQDH